MIAMAYSTSLEVVRKVFLGRDLTARQPEAKRLARERLDLRPVSLEPLRVEVLAHDGRRVLELGFEPRRRVRKSLLRGGEAIVGGAEGLGEALRDPALRLPPLAPEDDQVLRRGSARLWERILPHPAESPGKGGGTGGPPGGGPPGGGGGGGAPARGGS